MSFETARNFIYKNARPLDIARWKYLFENGCREDVLLALAVYRNEDGGFGDALEPDCWNPNSSPLQTWAATEIIKEIKLDDKQHSVIQGILTYLSSGKDLNGHIWANTILSNNAYPHAEWWDFRPDEERSYNPTACLSGFLLKFADSDSALYSMACRLVDMPSSIWMNLSSYYKNRFSMSSPMTLLSGYIKVL